MSQTIDITPHELSMVLQVLKTALPKDSRVWVFGSRAKHSARHNSDLDLAIDAGQPLDNTARMALQMGFEEAHLPYTVDTVDMQTVEPYFKEIIEQQQKTLPGWGNVPELRFPEFEGEWEVKTGNQLFKSRRERGDDDLPIYSVTQGNGLVPRDSLNRKMEADAASEQNLKVCPNDIVYNMMRMWQGAIGLSQTQCMVSPAYIVLKATKLASPDFFNYVFKRSRPLYDLWAYSYGLTNDRLRLYYKDFARIPFPVPKPNEQQKIADVLSSVDAKLAKLSRKKTLLEGYKRGLMQQIFSQKIRFKQDDGSEFPEWKSIVLSEVASFSKGKNISKDDVVEDGQTLCIRYGELYTQYSEKIQEVVSRTNLPKSELVFSSREDVIIPSSGESHLDIATASCVLEEGIALGGDLNIIRGDFSGVFLAYYLNVAKKKDIACLAQGNSVVHLYISQLSTLKISLPSIEEQQKIADFLSSFDQKIDFVAKQIKQLEVFKKGLLQKLFV